MDDRVKKLAFEGLINRVSANAGASVDSAILLKKEFVDKVIKVIAGLESSVILYLSGDAKLPEIGSTFVSRENGEDVEYVVAAIDYPNGTVETTFTTDETLYFKTTEDANNFINTGNKGSYDNWDRTKSDNYPFGATARVIKRKTFSFSNF